MREFSTVWSDAGKDFGLPYERGPIEPKELNQFESLPLADACFFDQSLHDVVERNPGGGTFHDVRPIWFSIGAGTLSLRSRAHARRAFCQSPGIYPHPAGAKWAVPIGLYRHMVGTALPAAHSGMPVRTEVPGREARKFSFDKATTRTVVGNVTAGRSRKLARVALCTGGARWAASVFHRPGFSVGIGRSSVFGADACSSSLPIVSGRSMGVPAASGSRTILRLRFLTFPGMAGLPFQSNGSRRRMFRKRRMNGI